MNEKNYIAGFGTGKGVVSENPVMDSVVELTPKEEAKAANRLPKVEQLDHFEKDLEERDSGNQPA